jgi:fatty-acyl-CoA synthase
MTLKDPVDLAAVSYSGLTPLAFLERSALVWADRTAVRDGERSWTYAEHAERVARAVGALREELDIGAGDRVAALLPNTHAMLELHYAVPGAGAVLVPLNTRLSSVDYAYILDHSGAVAIVATRGLDALLGPALESMGARAPRVVWVEDEYEELLGRAEPVQPGRPADECELLSISYTSGTTGRPKGVMTCHRGAYLHTFGVIAEAGLSHASSYLWTLPMFHCNGWAYTWAVTAAGGTHVCLSEIDPDEIWGHLLGSGITHMCAAPTVVSMLLGSDAATPCPTPVRLFLGGSPPSPNQLEETERLGIYVTHLYGLTETYGPIAVCAWNSDWDELPGSEKARLKARQGVSTVVGERLRVVDEELDDVPADGKTIGEIVMRGNNVMLGYYRDEDATVAAFRGGWFHSGDLGVMHADGYIELRDRLKDIVISGGENISTIEVEQALAAYPSIAEVAVVAAPDDRWGEVPVAFLTLRSTGEALDIDELREFARGRLARFKVPKRFEVVDELPKTGTGKIQKFALRKIASDRAVGPTL